MRQARHVPPQRQSTLHNLLSCNRNCCITRIHTSISFFLQCAQLNEIVASWLVLYSLFSVTMCPTTPPPPTPSQWNPHPTLYRKPFYVVFAVSRDCKPTFFSENDKGPFSGRGHHLWSRYWGVTSTLRASAPYLSAATRREK